jgi:hypothetical protein
MRIRLVHTCAIGLSIAALCAAPSAEAVKFAAEQAKEAAQAAGVDIGSDLTQWLTRLQTGSTKLMYVDQLSPGETRLVSFGKYGSTQPKLEVGELLFRNAKPAHAVQENWEIPVELSKGGIADIAASFLAGPRRPEASQASAKRTARATSGQADWKGPLQRFASHDGHSFFLQRGDDWEPVHDTPASASPPKEPLRATRQPLSDTHSRRVRSRGEVVPNNRPKRRRTR